MKIYNLDLKVKLILALVLMVILGGEWFFYELMVESAGEKFFEGILPGSAGMYSILFSSLSFLIIILFFKGILFQLSSVDSFYRIPVILVFIIGILIFVAGILKSDHILIQSSGFLIGIPSLFMSVVIFKEILKSEKRRDSEHEESS